MLSPFPGSYTRLTYRRCYSVGLHCLELTFAFFLFVVLQPLSSKHGTLGEAAQRYRPLPPLLRPRALAPDLASEGAGTLLREAGAH